MRLSSGLQTEPIEITIKTVQAAVDSGVWFLRQTIELCGNMFLIVEDLSVLVIPFCL